MSVNARASFLEDAMPKWMTKCERCHEVVGGEHVLLIGADGIVKTMYHIPCFLTANLEPGQLSDAVSANWGGQGRRAIPVDEWEGEGHS